MITFEEIQYNIEKKLKEIPFQIWILEPHNHQPHLVYPEHKEELFQPPSYPMRNTHQKYKISHQTNKTVLTFFCSEGHLVFICLHDGDFIPSEEQLEHLHLAFSLFFTQKLIKMREKELQTLVEGIHSITSSLNLDILLTKISASALAVIPPANCCLFQLYDEKKARLIPKGTVGFNEHIQLFQPRVGESITGKVFEEGRSRLFYSKEDMFKEMSNISEENSIHLFAAVASRSLNSLISVPVKMGEKRIGVMTVYQFNREGRLTERHLTLLEGFADQAAIAIYNAELYSEMKMRLKEVTDLSEQLQAKNEFLLKRNQIHATLTQLSLQNGGIDSIILELNRMIEKELSFINILEMEFYPRYRNTTPPFGIDEIEKIFSGKSHPVYVDLVERKKKESYYLYPIRSGAIFLGCFIVPLGSPLTQLEKITLEQGSSVLALELVKKRTLTEVYYKKTHEFFNDLLKNNHPELLAAKGKEFGLNLSPSSFLTVSLFEIATFQDQDLHALEVNIHRLASKIKRRMTTVNMLAFGFHNKVTLLLSLRDPAQLAEISQSLQLILEEWKDSDETPIRIGIGNPYEGVEHISKSYDEANKALSYLESRNQSALMHFKEIGINRLFLNQQPHEIQRFLHEILSPLWTEKAKNNDLEKTLITYLESNRSAIHTADKLHIHINTLYHRIKKIEELLNLRFDDPDDFLKIQLSCHLWTTFGSPS
ncbi:helix-turn-helix domain-containing protein [Ammoniphilus sp. 3BR4]|uniref:helix-turn-helix domain-containing protein n=1 Tax=Ammoniphilus sp. 3BR4 TaxID=3158265 RepID=UPI00346526F0